MAAHVNFDLDDAYDDAGINKDGARPLARLGSGGGEPLCGVIRRGGEVNTIGEAHGAAAELCRKLAQRSAQGWAASSKGDLVGVVKVTADTAAAVVVAGTTKAVATTARAQRACENLLDNATKLDTTGDGAWCVACGDAAKKLEPCAGRGCAAILCGRCQNAQKRCPGCKSKADARRKVLQRWAKEATKRPALDALARAFGHFSVDGSVTRDAFPSLVVASLGTEAVYEDDDPVLRDAFDACDADGDGLVDLHDVVDCVEIKIYGAFVLNRRVDLHAIDAALARWRGNAGSSPLEGASTSPRNDLVKSFRVHPTHWLISTLQRAA